jgi:hypothetical protein
VTTATANVQQRIIFTGVNDAAATVKQVQDQLKAAGTSAARASKEVAEVGRSAAASADTIKDKSGDVESALKGISDFSGEAGESVSKIGDAFGATEAILRLLPGPLGLVAAGVAAVALASKLLFDQWSQNSAKLALLTDPRTRELGDNLGFSADQTVKLQGALSALTTSARPPIEALRQVAETAEAVGGDPADAVAKFIGAWEKGPEAVRAVRSEIGDVSAALTTIRDVAVQLKLDPQALGLDKAKTQSEQLAAELTTLRDLQEQLTAKETRLAELYQTSVQAAQDRNVEESKYNLEVAKTTEGVIGRLQDQIAAQEELVRLRANEITQVAQANKVLQATARAQEEAALLAQLAGNKRIGQDIQLEALADKRAELLAEQARLMGLQKESGSDLIDDALRLLRLEIQRTDVAKQAIDRERAAEKEAKARAAAAEARQRRQREAAKRERAEQERRKQLVDDMEAVARGQEEAAKRLADAETARAKTSSETIKAVADARAGEADANAAIQEALGRFDAAEALRAEAAKVRREEEIRAINETMDARRKEAAERAQLLALDLQGDPAAKELEATNAALEAADIERQRQVAIAKVQADADRAEEERQRARRQRELAATQAQVQQVSAILGQGLSAFGAKGQGARDALSGVTTGVQGVVDNWGDLTKAAPGAINAVGSVASAFVEGEKSKAAISALMMLAQAAVAFATPNPVQGAAYLAAAAAFGAVAGGIISPGGSAGGGQRPGTLATETDTGGGFGAPAQGGATVINFNGIFATKQQVGKALTESQRSLSRTGLATVRGV